MFGASTSMKILVLSRFRSGSANVYGDFLFSFNAYSKHEYFYINDPRVLSRSFNFAAFDVVLLFWSYDWLRPQLSEDVVRRIAEAPGSRILFLQDEYRSVHLARAAINRFRIDHLYTLVDEKDHEAYYPRAQLPTLRSVTTVLAGYVPENLERMSSPPHAERPNDVVYRARTCAYYLGDLAQEKQIIAERFDEAAGKAGLTCDISTWEGDRIYGKAYGRFLKSARCVLGTESGASVVDFDGRIQSQCEAYCSEHPTATYEEVKRRFFADVDGKIFCRTISPRIFESTALGNTLVLHEGDYCGILRPGRHYIEVKKDYSNLDSVIEQIRDRGLCERIAEYARRDLIDSQRFSYREFVRQFDADLEARVTPVVDRRTGRRSTFYAWNFFRHGQGVIPHGTGYVRIPNVDLVRDNVRRTINQVGLNVVRRLVPNPKMVWNLRTGVRVLLSSTWHRLPEKPRRLLTPIAKPVQKILHKTLFKPF